MKTKRAFTLIELLVVIAIISLLASIVLVSLSSAKNKAKDAAIKSEMVSARSQAEVYRSNNNQSYTGLCSSAISGNIVNFLTATDGLAFNAGIQLSPFSDSKWNKPTCHETGTAWAADTPLKASTPANPVWWCVDSTGKSKQELGLPNMLGSSDTTCA